MKQTIRVTLSLLAAAGLLTLCTVAFYRALVPNAHAGGAGDPQSNSSGKAHAKPCSLSTIEGTHGYTYSGTVLAGSIAAAGPITFDGEGNLSADYTASVGGVTHQGKFKGTYTVNPDCTGSATLHLPLLNLETSGTFVIVNDGDGTFFVGTDAGITVNGITKRQ
jgi:hypothetical protein